MAKFDNKYKPKKKADERKVNVRAERNVDDELPKIVFSLKDFDRQQVPPGQDYEEWQRDTHLSDLMKQLENLCQLNMIEAKQQNIITEYGRFPSNSDFRHPRHIADDVSWAVIKKVFGQRGRVVGHIIGNVFYIVFFDADHRFWITER